MSEKPKPSGPSRALGLPPKIEFSTVGLPQREWKPLKSFPATPHREQERINEYLRVPSKGPM